MAVMMNSMNNDNIALRDNVYSLNNTVIDLKEENMQLRNEVKRCMEDNRIFKEENIALKEEISLITIENSELNRKLEHLTLQHGSKTGLSLFSSMIASNINEFDDENKHEELKMPTNQEEVSIKMFNTGCFGKINRKDSLEEN